MQREDEKIQGAVESALADQMRLSSFDINVTVKDGVVQLSGVVDVLAEKVKAEEIAKKIAGVRGIENHLTVSTDGRLIDDKEITDVVQERLQAHLGDVLKYIEVTTHKGVVYLEGNANSLWEKHQAAKVAQSVRGVSAVISHLGVKKRERQDDASLTNAVELALSRQDKVEAGMVKTSTKNGVVTLEGEVDSPEEVAKVYQIAASVPGVKAVVMKLRTRHDSADRDNDLTLQLRQLLREDPRVSPSQVQAFVIGDTAYLSGEVGSIEAKEAAEEAAGRLPGIRGVSNDIFVARH